MADQIRSLILQNHLKSGDDLPSEAELIETHQFSRGTVREALRLLESDGLITIKRGPKGGIKVRHPDTTRVSRGLALTFTFEEVTLGQFLALRKLVEGEAAALAAQHATPEQCQILLELTSTDGEGGDLRRSFEFHDYLGQCTKNGVFKVILSAIHEVVKMQTPLERLTDNDIQATKSVHKKIAKAIADGDADEAKRTMLSHLSRYEEILADRGRLDEAVIPRSSWATP